jgi:hypothetical protein
MEGTKSIVKATKHRNLKKKGKVVHTILSPSVSALRFVLQQRLLLVRGTVKPADGV